MSILGTMRGASILLVAGAALTLGAGTARSGEPGDARPRAAAQDPAARMADLKARLAELEQRTGACAATAKEHAAAGRMEMSESYARIARALHQEAKRIREVIAGHGPHDGALEDKRAPEEKFAEWKQKVAALKRQSEAEENAGHAAQKEGREAEAVEHMEASGKLWRKAEELEREIGELEPRRAGSHMRISADLRIAELRKMIAEWAAQAAEFEAKSKEFDAKGWEGAAAENMEKAKAARAEAEALHQKLEEMGRKSRAAQNDAEKEPRKEKESAKEPGRGDGLGQKAADELRAAIHRLEAQIHELRAAIESLRSPK